MSSRTPRTGELAPDFDLVDCFARPWRLSENLAAAALVLVFYRGQW
jgi:peroxiredoxin